VHTVLSEGNAADPLTRNKPLDNRRNRATVEAVRESLGGWPKTVLPKRPRDKSHEEDLEYEWDEELDDMLDVNEDVPYDA